MKNGIAIVFLFVGILFLIFYSSKNSSHFHFTLSDFQKKLKETPSSLKGRYLTIYGFVKEGSIQKKGIQANFILNDNNSEIPIFFNGKTLLPDTFKEGSQASVDGVYNFDTNHFVADKVLAKCASKYKEKSYEKQ